MKILKHKDMTRGWFVGDFLPTAYRTKNCEVSVIYFKKGKKDEKHHHKIATEITMIVKGKILADRVKYSAGDIIVQEPNESSDFTALTNGVLVVVKVPSVKDDKYFS